MNNKNYNYLSHLFKSKTRSALLAEFTLNPRQRFYMRELERLLKISVGNIRRELNNLEWQGLVKSEKVGNLKFYFLNKESPVYKPIQELIAKTVGIPTMLEKFIGTNKNIRTAFIFGSYAKGDLENTSDIDLFIVVENGSIIDEIYNYLDQMEQRFGREINTHIMSQKELSQKLKSKNPFVQDITKGKIIFIKGGENDLRLEAGKKTAG